MQEQTEKLIVHLKALADPIRLRLLALCVRGEATVTELTSVTDVVECPRVTPVPRAKVWLRGIANVRGSLYSIVDLALFLGYEQQTSETEGRLLVLNVGELGCV